MGEGKKIKVNVLMVDDEKNIVTSMAEYFELTNLAVETHIASNADDALEIIDNHIIHLAFIDVIMPKVGGFEFLKYLQKSQPKCHAYIWSGLNTTDTESAAAFHGAKGFIGKPFHPDEIVGIVEEYINNQV